MEYLCVEFVCKCIYVYFTYILDGAGMEARKKGSTTVPRTFTLGELADLTGQCCSAVEILGQIAPDFERDFDRISLNAE
jgi:hypothetical protein